MEKHEAIAHAAETVVHGTALHSLILLLPIFGAILIGLGGFLFEGFRKSEKLIGYFATLMVLIPFGIVVYTFLTADGPVEVGLLFGEPLSWMGSSLTGMLNISFTYRLDHLSLIMALVVTGVGSLIHLYSTAYMHKDRGYYKFFLYLNLFIFAMLNLILGDNLAVVFLGWEGVGACSYFLIGFWYENMNNAKAAQKAFVANRIGDFAMIVALMIIVTQTGTLNMHEIIQYVNTTGFVGTGRWLVPLLLFIAATGKSAQIPLYVWLPDAMAGPTPVSALIHAATMVTSGIYLIARMSPLFEAAPEIKLVVAFVGALTAIVAALIAMAQNDIKKVLAYSTVSQLGFMFMALGAGAYTTAIFHVMTHAFFKACLFLGSGSVIHAMDHMHTVKDPQDIRTMGGLKKYMPATHWTFFLSTLAIAGIPIFSGFFSKDEILGKVFGMGDNEDLNFWYYTVYAIGILTAALTAFYMTRVYFLTFRGKERFPHDHHPHESPLAMTFPLIVLALLAVIGGLFGLPEVFNEILPIKEGTSVHLLNSYLAGTHELPGPVVGYPHENHPPMALDFFLIFLSIVIAVSGVMVSWRLYSKHDLAGDEIVARRLKKLYPAMQNKFGVDEFYERMFINPFVWSGKGIIMAIDKYVIDGFVNGLGTVTLMVGQVMKRLQSGFVGHYALLIVVGMLAILSYLIFV